MARGYSNYDFSKIKNFISRLNDLDSDEKDRLFEEENLKEKMVEDFFQGRGNFYAYFRSLISEIGVETFLKYYDFDKIHKYFEKEGLEYEEYKLFVCLIETDSINEVLRYSLTDSVLFDQLFEQQDQMYSIFSNIEYNLLVGVIKKIEESNLQYESTFLRSVEEDKKCMLLQENFKDETLWWLLPNLGQKVTQYFFLNDKRALTVIEQKKANVPSLIDMGIKFSSDILYTELFFDEIKSRSLVEFRRRINLLMQNNPNIVIEEKVDKYESEMLLSYHSETGLFKEYESLTLDNLQEKIDQSTNEYLLSYKLLHDAYSIRGEAEEVNKKFYQYLKKETSRKISEIVIDGLFKDNYYNVQINLKEILRYQKKNKDGFILDIAYVKLYELLCNIDQISNEKKIELYNQLKSKNINTIFYEHLRKCKDHAYSDMVSKLFNTENTSFINEELSQKNDIKTYELNGQDFTMMVRGMYNFRENTGLQRNCYSLIDNKNIEVMDGYDYYYGYYNIDKNNIMHVFENDCFSSDTKEGNTRMINRIMTTSEISNVGGYSEIQIINHKTDDGYKTLRPDYLVVFDDIEEKDIREAKRLNIPIVKINSEKYKTQNKEPSHMLYTNVIDGCKYIEFEHDEASMLREGKRR